MKDLLFFYGDECDYCIETMRDVDRLIGEGFDIKKLEVWNNKENDSLMIKLDKGENMCGGVPFFLNQNTNNTICGETSYKEIRKWAEGK
jgi:hypothetical protein